MNNRRHLRTRNSNNQSPEESKQSIEDSKHDIVANIVIIAMVDIMSVCSPHTQPDIEHSVEDHPPEHAEHDPHYP